MSNKPREWPNIAKWARDDSADEAFAGLRATEKLLFENMTESQRIVNLQVVNRALNRILRNLVSVGAPVRFE